VRAFQCRGLAILACIIFGHAAAADPVSDAFYERCTTENSYTMQPAELNGACACMAPVLASFLTVEARHEIEAALKSKRPASFAGSPFKGNPADLARTAIKECPMVGEAMYQQKCAGKYDGAPECQEMKKMIDEAH
jgi:hypothetical protein